HLADQTDAATRPMSSESRGRIGTPGRSLSGTVSIAAVSVTRRPTDSPAGVRQRARARSSAVLLSGGLALGALTLRHLVARELRSYGYAPSQTSTGFRKGLGARP